MAVLLLFVTILAGNIMARDCVYFDDEKIQIEKAFKKPKVYKWSEIRKVDGDFDNWINLYLGDGTKVLTAGLAQVNYRLFRNAVKVQCSGAVAGYYQEKAYEHPQKCILRYGPENFLLAGLGIVIFLLYVAILATEMSLLCGIYSWKVILLNGFPSGLRQCAEWQASLLCLYW